MSWFSKVSRFVKNHLPTDHIDLETLTRGAVRAARFVPVVGSVVAGLDAVGATDKLTHSLAAQERKLLAAVKKVG